MPLEVDKNLIIPDSDLRLATSRSSGPGGQNVNKVESRVTIFFDLAGSTALDDAQKERLRSALGGRIDRRGLLRVSSQRHRTQAANRRAAEERLGELLRQALAPEPERRPTRPPARARRRRLEAKKRRGRLKAERRGPSPEER